MIKRYHEAPLGVFKQVQQLTDGDYALVHLFETNEKYLEAFKVAVASGRDVILDNSIFELGTAFEGDKYVHWISELNPTWYIVPDCWKNGEVTTEMFFHFVNEYPQLEEKLKCRRIGVAQGWTVEEVTKCYKAIEPYCDMVAFNLDFSSIYYETLPECLSQQQKEAMVPYCVAMSLGRHMVLTQLWQSGVINVHKPHHLLGCGVPQEVMLYPRSWTWIRSIDTSNPVVAGIEHWVYDPIAGINKKSDKKLCNLIDMKIDDKDPTWYVIRGNIQKMQRWC